MSSSSHSRLSSPSKSTKARSGTTSDASKSESKDVVPELKSPTRKIKKKSTSAEEASTSTEKTEVDSVLGSPKSSDKKKIKKKTKTTGDIDASSDGANEDKAKRSSSVKRSSSSKRTTSKSPSPRSRRTEDSGEVETGELVDSPTKSRRKGTKLSSKEEPSKDVSSGASSRGRSRSPMPGVAKEGAERILRSPVGKEKTVDTDTVKQLNEKNAEIEQLRAELASLKGKGVPNGPKSILKEDPSQQERAIFEKDATIASQREIIDRLKKDLIALENDGSGKKYKARLAAAELENSTLKATMASERREARIKLEEKDELIASLRREVAKLGGNPGPETESNSQHMRSDPPEELNDMSAKSLDLLYAIREDTEMTGAEPLPKRMSGTKKPTSDKGANDDPSSKSKSSGSIGKLFGMSKSRSKEREPKKSKTPPVELRHKSKRAPRTESSPPVF